MPQVHPVKIELAKRGQTQVDFAEKVDVSAGTLNHVLNGRLTAWPARRSHIADALDCAEGDLFTEAAQ